LGLAAPSLQSELSTTAQEITFPLLQAVAVTLAATPAAIQATPGVPHPLLVLHRSPLPFLISSSKILFVVWWCV